jgi:hypothetical protein
MFRSECAQSFGWLTEDAEEVFPHKHLSAFEEIDEGLDGGLGIGMAGTASSGPRAGRVEARLGPMMTDGRESEASIFLNRAAFSSVISTKAMPMPR